MWIQPALSESMMSKSFRIASKKGAGSPDSAVDPVFIVDVVISFIHLHTLLPDFEGPKSPASGCCLCRRPATSYPVSPVLFVLFLSFQSSLRTPECGVRRRGGESATGVVVVASSVVRVVPCSGDWSVQPLSSQAAGQVRARFLHLNCHL